MQITCKNGNVLEKVAVINRPTYVKHNAYGNIHYYSVLEPKTDVTLEDLRDEKIRKAYSKYKSTEEIANDFYQWNPEETGGRLNDFKSIHFLGHEYIYRPNHKTHYGNVDRRYFLLPIIARWYYIVTGKNMENVLTQTAFGRNMGKKFKRLTYSTGKVYTGIKLRIKPDDASKKVAYDMIDIDEEKI